MHAYSPEWTRLIDILVLMKFQEIYFRRNYHNVKHKGTMLQKQQHTKLSEVGRCIKCRIRLAGCLWMKLIVNVMLTI
jgi:succinate dehydrogenase/fumarate reductase-like Fe-S protein